MLDGIRTAMQQGNDVPWSSERIFKFANTTLSSAQMCSMASKNEIPRQIHTMVMPAGVDQCTMPFRLFPYQQQRNVTTCAKTFCQLFWICLNCCWGGYELPMFAAQVVNWKRKFSTHRHQAAREVCAKNWAWIPSVEEEQDCLKPYTDCIPFGEGIHWSIDRGAWQSWGCGYHQKACGN